jgi:hypothetical protein
MARKPGIPGFLAYMAIWPGIPEILDFGVPGIPRIRGIPVPRISRFLTLFRPRIRGRKRVKLGHFFDPIWGQKNGPYGTFRGTFLVPRKVKKTRRKRVSWANTQETHVFLKKTRFLKKVKSLVSKHPPFLFRKRVFYLENASMRNSTFFQDFASFALFS